MLSKNSYKLQIKNVTKCALKGKVIGRIHTLTTLLAVTLLLMTEVFLEFSVFFLSAI